mmetsp:Transcript_24696/g.68735  ORF Transcript_24696/g.68735 Transcript_24696/m.68735 type:complete len:269 (-) Transcript_24696:5643-6449(-)
MRYACRRMAESQQLVSLSNEASMGCSNPGTLRATFSMSAMRLPAAGEPSSTRTADCTGRRPPLAPSSAVNSRWSALRSCRAAASAWSLACSRAAPPLPPPPLPPSPLAAPACGLSLHLRSSSTKSTSFWTVGKDNAILSSSGVSSEPRVPPLASICAATVSAMAPPATMQAQRKSARRAAHDTAAGSAWSCDRMARMGSRYSPVTMERVLQAATWIASCSAPLPGRLHCCSSSGRKVSSSPMRRASMRSVAARGSGLASLMTAAAGCR